MTASGSAGGVAFVPGAPLLKMKDERKGRISMSKLEQAALCPGSYEIQKGMPEETNALATSGTKIHDGLEHDDFSKLTEEERDLAERAAELREELIDGFFLTEPMFEEIAEDAKKNHQRETRLYAFDNRVSGQFDGMVVDRSRALLYDYKTGYLEPIEARRNLQMRGYAVLVAENFPEITQITTAIIQPRIRPEVSLAQYDHSDLKNARAEVLAILDRAYAPGARRQPGPIQCQYCKAKAKCPEAAALAHSLSKVEPGEITAERLPDLLQACSAAKKIIAAIESQAKTVLEADPGAVPGFTLKQGAKMQTITDPQKLFNRMNERHSVLPHEFVEVCSVGKGKVKDLLKEASRLKGKALDEELSSLLEGISKETRKAPTLTKSK